MDEPRTGGKNISHPEQLNSMKKRTSDEVADGMNRAEIEEITEKYLQWYREYSRESYKEKNSMPQKAQRRRNESNTPTGGGGKGSRRHSYPVIPPLQNPVIPGKPTQPTYKTTSERLKQQEWEEEPTEEDVLILEPIIGIFDVKLRKELIRRAGDTNYMGLLKIAEAWYSTEITQAATISDITNVVDGLTEEETQVPTLYNGGSNGNEETNVNLRHELYCESSDEIERGVVTEIEAQPDTENIRERPTRSKMGKAKEEGTPPHSKRESEVRLRPGAT
jgi:hypothetical protein